MEDEEIQRQRRIYTYGGGFCFKARSISIEYVWVEVEDGKELIFHLLRRLDTFLEVSTTFKKEAKH
jgi:hypothetical protein